MSIYLCGELDPPEIEGWLKALREALPDEHIEASADRLDPAKVDIALVANPRPGSLKTFTSLRLIQSLWAGVDRLLMDASLPSGVPLCRMVDGSMSAAMAETALWAVLSLHRGFFDYAEQQRAQQWIVLPQRRADECQVAVLGLGELGRAVASRLVAQGYAVHGWRQGGRSAAVPLAAGVSVHEGRGSLPSLLACSDLVVNLLPLTDDTRGLFDAQHLSAMKAGASLINLARGAHVVEADLLAALDRGHLSRAVLDVFQREPLAPSHPFWTHPRITVLPHAAALTDSRSAARVVAANVRASREGRPLANLVDRARGY